MAVTMHLHACPRVDAGGVGRHADPHRRLRERQQAERGLRLGDRGVQATFAVGGLTGVLILVMPRLLGLAERAWASNPAWATEADAKKAAVLGRWEAGRRAAVLAWARNRPNSSRPVPCSLWLRSGCTALRAASVAASTSSSSTPRSQSSVIQSPSITRAMGPSASASGLRWMAAGTLPEAPLMRPSVTSATLKPLSCSTASGGVSLCSSGMPLARGPW